MKDGALQSAMVIGCVEYVDFPEWGIFGLRAKVDTGARSSALHVENLHEVGGGRVRFEVRLRRKDVNRRVQVEAAISRRGRVRPSSGQFQERIFVRARLRIASVEREVEVSLVDREKMLFRMLIGRSAVAEGFLVDPGRRHVATGKSRKARAPR